MRTFMDSQRSNTLVLRSFRKSMLQNLIMLLIICVIACPITLYSYTSARSRFFEQQEDVLNASVGAVNDSLVSLEMLLNTAFDNNQLRAFSIKRELLPQDYILVRNAYESLTSICANYSLLADLFIVFENSSTVLSSAGAFATLAGRSGMERFLSYYRIGDDFAQLLRGSSRSATAYYTDCPALHMPNDVPQREIAFVYHLPMTNLTNVRIFILISQAALEECMQSLSGALTLYNSGGTPIASTSGNADDEHDNYELNSQSFSRIHATLCVNLSSLNLYLAPTVITIACFAVVLIVLSLLLSYLSAYRTSQPVRHAVEKLQSYGFECKDAQETYQFFLSCIESIQLEEKRNSILNASLKKNLDQSIVETYLRSPISAQNDELPTLDHFPQQYVVAYALVCIGENGSISEDAEGYILQLQSMLSSRLAHELNALFIAMSPTASVLIIPADSDRDQQLDRLEQLITSSNAISPFSISVAVSTVHSSLSQLNAAYESVHSFMSEFANRPGVHRITLADVPASAKLRCNEDMLLYESILKADVDRAHELLAQIMARSDSRISIKQCYYYARMPLLLAMNALSLEPASFSMDYAPSLSPADLMKQLDDVSESLCEEVRHQLTTEQDYVRAGMLRLSEEIRNFIIAHYLEDTLSVQSICEAVKTNEKNLNVACRMATGMNVSAYIQQLRLDKAASMLRNSDARVNDILLSCGYNTPNAFFKAFKRVYGQSPSEYRASFRS